MFLSFFWEICNCYIHATLFTFSFSRLFGPLVHHPAVWYYYSSFFVGLDWLVGLLEKKSSSFKTLKSNFNNKLPDSECTVYGEAQYWFFFRRVCGITSRFAIDIAELACQTIAVKATFYQSLTYMGHSILWIGCCMCVRYANLSSFCYVNLYFDLRVLFFAIAMNTFKMFV